MLDIIICIDEFCIKSVLQPLKSRVELKIYIKMINFYLLGNDTRYEEQLNRLKICTIRKYYNLYN